MDTLIKNSNDNGLFTGVFMKKSSMENKDINHRQKRIFFL